MNKNEQEQQRSPCLKPFCGSFIFPQCTESGWKLAPEPKLKSGVWPKVRFWSCLPLGVFRPPFHWDAPIACLCNHTKGTVSTPGCNATLKLWLHQSHCLALPLGCSVIALISLPDQRSTVLFIRRHQRSSSTSTYIGSQVHVTLLLHYTWLIYKKLGSNKIRFGKKTPCAFMTCWSWCSKEALIISLHFDVLCGSYVTSFLYISHCHGDYSYTLMSQIINFLRLIPSKWLSLGSFHQYIQLLQHQISKYT